ncbi:hypothetical protein PybrP1_001241 [[Pythium] brassicae (nom. inval.)]|nr:hypothetical protein PybrP1_001241 [[Pythium] brassicae (nom. inval.)]
MAEEPPPSAAHQALAANRALEQQLRAVAATLAEEERQLRRRMQTVRQRLAMRRTNRAVAELGALPLTTTARTASDVFAKTTESRYRPVAPELPRSFIRPKRSFFSDADAAPPRKRGRKPKGFHEQLRVQRLLQQRSGVEDDPSEPAPNADTRALRRFAHEAFVATPPNVFTPKERKLLREFADAQLKAQRALCGGAGAEATDSHSLPLETWNLLTTRSKAPVQRSGFACMLRWELHDKPGLRLCAWTKEEDAALRALASGEVDPALVNHWEEIARRMPVPGRPPVHCLTRYQSKLCATNVLSSFTPEEDALIRQAVAVFGERWSIIADLMDGRVPEQIRHRWQLTLSPLVKHGKYSVVEDRRMLLALYVYHDRTSPFRKETAAWTDVSHHVPGRQQPSLRDRFLNSLNAEISFTPWKPQDDAKLLRLVDELGWNCPGLWARIAAEIGNRSDNQVARRWRWLAPEAYDKYRKEKQETVATLPAIFQRPMLVRNRARRGESKAHAKRSSYVVDEASDGSSDSDDSGDSGGEDSGGGGGNGRTTGGEHAGGGGEKLLAQMVEQCLPFPYLTMLTVSAASVKRSALASRGASRSLHSQFKMDDNYDPAASNQHTPIITSTKAVKCLRPKEWSPQVEEAFRVQQAGWRDLKEYMETYGQPERWENGRAHRECEDKYMHSVKLFEYA